MNTKTLIGEFEAGMKSGEYPNPANDEKAIKALAYKTTEPLIRAYWSGYYCQKQIAEKATTPTA